jgi:hypothetical protein
VSVVRDRAQIRLQRLQPGRSRAAEQPSRRRALASVRTGALERPAGEDSQNLCGSSHLVGGRIMEVAARADSRNARGLVASSPAGSVTTFFAGTPSLHPRLTVVMRKTTPLTSPRAADRRLGEMGTSWVRLCTQVDLPRCSLLRPVRRGRLRRYTEAIRTAGPRPPQAPRAGRCLVPSSVGTRSERGSVSRFCT